MSTPLSDFQRRVGEWAARTFPEGTDAGTLAHLRREVDEMAAHVYDPHPYLSKFPEEAADVLILLVNLAHRKGFDLMAAAERKQAVNEGRTWGEPDAEGVIEHVRS